MSFDLNHLFLLNFISYIRAENKHEYHQKTWDKFKHSKSNIMSFEDSGVFLAIWKICNNLHKNDSVVLYQYFLEIWHLDIFDFEMDFFSFTFQTDSLGLFKTKQFCNTDKIYYCSFLLFKLMSFSKQFKMELLSCFAWIMAHQLVKHFLFF